MIVATNKIVAINKYYNISSISDNNSKSNGIRYVIIV